MSDRPEVRPPTSDVPSRELIARVQAGDDRALETLCARYLPRLRRWASGRLPGWARERLDTDDLVQDALVQTLHQLDRFEPRFEGALQAYLRQALLNRIRDEVRRSRRHPSAGPVVDEEPDPGPSPLEQTIGREALARYENALARLRAEDREAIVARLEMGCSYEEVAQALGKPSPDAARMTVSRALVRLAAQMSHGR